MSNNKSQNDLDKSSLPNQTSFDWSITNIVRLLREIALLGILVYLAFNFINGDIGISFGTKALTASEIISILLAFFAILLSAAFYYMSTQQSNLFYHNVHQFTKDTSEILGRLDEQVKHIGGRQTELKDTFEKNYAYNNQNGVTQKKEEKINEELEKKDADLKEKERNINQKIDSLIEKIESEDEKEKLKIELERERNEIKKLKSEMEEKSNLLHVIQRVKNQTKQFMTTMDLEDIVRRRPSSLMAELISKTGPQLQKDMSNLGYINIEDKHFTVTKNGMRFLREMRNELMAERENNS
ncbi:hypothetical protein [Acinetobacter harbinensis]|uniref:hypothetical protein n=1 Tax=Acinetobacter harbinensis TaxID=1353941 RepID=UPI001C4F82BF|nr:hypothetical protein [Acinetobacter harbinensis]